MDRDFVIATVVSPTILVEPEKTEEVTAEGETPAEEISEGTGEGAVKTEEGKEKSAKLSDEKTKDKSTKPSDNKAKTESGDKGKTTNKETKNRKYNVIKH